MAKANTKDTAKAPATTKPGTGGTALAAKQAAAVATTAEDIDYAADAGAGLQDADSDSYAIPFLICLQKSSPQVDEASGDAVEGAKPGMFFNTVSRKLYSGKDGVMIIPCAYRRVFIRWGGRESRNKGFKGELSADAVTLKRESGEIQELNGGFYFPDADGSINEKLSDRVSDTRNHYVMVVDGETGEASEVLLSLTSTQIKKSKALNSMLAGIRFNGPDGSYKPPTFATVVKLTSIPEQNDKGSWHGVRFEYIEQMRDKALYSQAKGFEAQVRKGTAHAGDYSAATGANATTETGEGRF